MRSFSAEERERGGEADNADDADDCAHRSHHSIDNIFFVFLFLLFLSLARSFYQSPEQALLLPLKHLPRDSKITRSLTCCSAETISASASLGADAADEPSSTSLENASTSAPVTRALAAAASLMARAGRARTSRVAAALSSAAAPWSSSSRTDGGGGGGDFNVAFEEEEAFLLSPGVTFSTSIASSATSLPMVLVWCGRGERECRKSARERERTKPTRVDFTEREAINFRDGDEQKPGFVCSIRCVLS